MTKRFAASLFAVLFVSALARGDDAGTAKPIRLDDYSKGRGDWTFICPDKKATGSLDVVKDPEDSKKSCRMKKQYFH